MTPKEAYNAMVSRYMNEFNGQFPIAVDNKKFEKPNPQDTWVRISVKYSTGNQSTLGRVGNRKFLKLGILYMQIFTPINKGTDDNNTLANSSVNLMDGERLGKLWMHNGRIETIGPDGEFYQQNAVVEFEFEDIR